jgi:hypothetical protein
VHGGLEEAKCFSATQKEDQDRHQREEFVVIWVSDFDLQERFVRVRPRVQNVLSECDSGLAERLKRLRTAGKERRMAFRMQALPI